MCMNSGAKDAARKSIKDWKQAWTEIDSWIGPYRDKGAEGFQAFFDKVMAGPGQYESSPQYNFMFDEGMRALERNAGAQGALGSGVHRRELMQYGQNMALLGRKDWLNEYYQSLSPWAQLSEIGLNAANQSGNFKLETTKGLTNARQALGAAKDAGAHNLFSTGMGLAGLTSFGLGLAGFAGVGPLRGLSKLGQTTAATTTQPLTTLGGGGASSFGTMPGVWMPPNPTGVGWT